MPRYIGTDFSDRIPALIFPQPMGGNDTLVGGFSNDTLLGGAGDDVIYGRLENESQTNDLLGRSDDDVIDGQDGNDRLFGDRGNDNVAGGSGNDQLFGGAGNDRLDGGLGNDVIDGGEGDDVLISGVSPFPSLFLDTLRGGAGNDTLFIQSPGVRAEGGAGDDVYVWTSSAGLFFPQLAGIVETATGGIDRLQVDVGDVDGLTAFVEHLKLMSGQLGRGNALNNVIEGNDIANTLEGLDGNDVIRGLGGNDVLRGGTGSNTLFGGAGDDTFFVTGSDTIVGDAGVDTIRLEALATFTVAMDATVENLIGNDANSTVVGNALANSIEGAGGVDVLSGGAGADTLSGGAGNDSLDGGTEADRLVGGLGFDTIQGGDGNDVVVWTDTDSANGGAGVDTFDASSRTTNWQVNLGTGGTNVSGEVVAGFEILLSGSGGDTLTGGVANETIFGGAGADFVNGAGGSNTLYGGAGGDRLFTVGSGSDSLYGGADGDYLDANARSSLFGVIVDGGSGDDILDLAQGTVILDTVLRFSNVERLDVLATTIVGTSFADQLDFAAFATVAFGAPLGLRIDGGAGNDVVGGSQVVAANDTLLGGDGLDAVRGGGGADRIDGGLGADVLIGGQAADVFVFATADASTFAASDTLRAGDGAVAFEGVGIAGGDVIDLSAIDANAFVDGNQAFGFGGFGVGALQSFDDAGRSIFVANIDADPEVEFRLVIEDGGVLASSYRAGDFIL